MGTISIQVVGDTSVGTKSKSFTVSDADVNRLVAWAKAAYPIIDPVTGAISVPTTAQALTSWASGIMQGTIANVRGAEQQTAQAAVAPPPAFTAT